MKLPTEIKPEQITAICDTREQLPLDLSPLQTVRGTLVTGDYSCLGCEDLIALERKSESDFLGCCGGGRERFEKELKRMLAYPCRALLIESTWERIEAGHWQSKITPASAMGSLLGWIAMGVPVVMCGTHKRAGVMVSHMLFIAARRRWRESRSLANGITSGMKK